MLACLKRGILKIISRRILLNLWANLGENFYTIKIGIWDFDILPCFCGKAFNKYSRLYLHKDIHQGIYAIQI